jgi:hypothetical protein
MLAGLAAGLFSWLRPRTPTTAASAKRLPSEGRAFVTTYNYDAAGRLTHVTHVSPVLLPRRAWVSVTRAPVTSYSYLG